MNIELLKWMLDYLYIPAKVDVHLTVWGRNLVPNFSPFMHGVDFGLEFEFVEILVTVFCGWLQTIFSTSDTAVYCTYNSCYEMFPVV